MSEAADRHFSYPKYTQDEWDGLEDEIERLKDTQHVMQSSLKEQTAEIERLRNLVNSSAEAMQAVIDSQGQLITEAGARNGELVIKLREKDLIITELCDELERIWSTGAANTGTPVLIRKGRKAVNGH